MGKIPIVARNGTRFGKDLRQPSECYLIARPLPVFYMSDYSVLGVMVDDLEEAIRVLGENQFSMTHQGGDTGVEVTVDAPARLLEIVQLLTANGVHCEIADLVSGIYQG